MNRTTTTGSFAIAACSCVWAQPAPQQSTFPTPETALAALKAAANSQDREALRAIFGPLMSELSSGDETEDAADLAVFARRLDAMSRVAPQTDEQFILYVGPENHPFPVPIVKYADAWFFDTETGKEEILNRRIGENEIRAMQVCRAYVVAQEEYQAIDRDNDGVREYARQLASTPGQRDGLYWPTEASEPLSPLGPLVAQAHAEGYRRRANPGDETTAPYQGYRFRILTRQGTDAPGGAFDYVINGNMVAGYAFLAFPAQWGTSGIMTFLVNSNGRIMEQDLGESTTELAQAINEYNPDETRSEATD